MSRLALLHSQMKKVIGGRSLPFLSIAGNVFTVKDGENAQNVSAMDRDNGNVVFVDMHVIDSSLWMSKMFYVGDYDPDADPVAPTCYSNDGFRPAQDVSEPQSDYCAQCPMNAWGSKVSNAGKKSKACTDGWKLAVIVPEHKDDKVLMFRVPPASLQSWLAYLAQFSDYDLPGADRKMTVMDVTTRVYFESGKQGILNFMPLNILHESDEGRQMFNTAEAIVDSRATEMYIGLDNISTEKKEEMLQLAAPSNAPQITHQPAPKPAAKIAAPVSKFKQAEVEETEEEADEEEEAAAAPAPVTKAKNAVLPSEGMRFKTGAKPSAAAAAPAANGLGGKLKTAASSKPEVSAGVKNMLTNLMKIK